ncbi:MAG: hypothetical protein B1H04_02675 [Planctomycetales bacterium 4484_123]|nr:MAG: hypothetical protein B1H04_02675 [Planctomycetales bacterium 4484_123]
MVYLWAMLLVLVNTAWLALSLLALPGNWLMVLTTVLVAWWRWDPAKSYSDQMFSIYVLAAIVLLAVAGEIVEFFAGAAGARKAGGSWWASIGALLGGIVGVVVGTLLIPIPLLGTIIGAGGGACLGAWGLEALGGHKGRRSLKAGLGAGVGWIIGAATKAALGALIWLIVAVAAFWP